LANDLVRKKDGKPLMRQPWGWELPKLSEDQIHWLDDWFARRGLSAAEATPRICSERCLFRPHCPLVALEQVTMPIGCPCPVEATIMENWSVQMKEALGLDDDDLWSKMLVEYGAMWTVLLMRAQSEPGADKIVVDSYRGVDKEGNALYEKKVNPSISFSQSVQKILQAIGKELIATREAKAKLKQAKGAPGPDEFVRVVEAQFVASDGDVDAKSEKIRAKRESTTSPDDTEAAPRVPHVDNAGLTP
jgi:hypothetical protein